MRSRTDTGSRGCWLECVFRLRLSTSLQKDGGKERPHSNIHVATHQTSLRSILSNSVCLASHHLRHWSKLGRMAYDGTTSERLVSLFAYRPRYIVNGQITIAESAAVANIDRKTDPSGSLGKLDTLPLELLHVIFAMLDFKTLSHIQRTCLRGIGL